MSNEIYYRYQYADSTCLYLLKNAQFNKSGYEDGVYADYSVDDGKKWIPGGFFRFSICGKFYRLKKLPRKPLNSN